MRAAVFVALAALLGGCIPPVNADTAELAWQRCSAEDAVFASRIGQCSIVIGFDGTSPERRAAALIVRGSLRSDEGQYVRALADLGRAMRLDAENPQIYLHRGFVHQARGAYDFALRDFDRALALQPGLQAALDARAEVFAQQTETYREDLEQLTAALERTPTDAEMLNARCWLRTVNNDDLDAALTDCNASLLAVPNDANVHDSRGLVYFKRGDYAASLADYEAAVRLEPERGHFLYGRGLARLALGMSDEGNADIARAEELEPGVTRAYQGYNILPPKPPEPVQQAD